MTSKLYYDMYLFILKNYHISGDYIKSKYTYHTCIS